jgi:calcineurin-like phosphoesterase family protein
MIWLAADLHIGHTNIIKYQPERLDILALPADATVDEHDEALIKRWNSVVSGWDEVLFLGDLAMGQRHLNIPKTAQLNGRKTIIAPGNHDTGLWPLSATAEYQLEKRLAQRKLFTDAGWAIPADGVSGDVWDIEDVKVTYSHLPLAGTPDHDNEEARFQRRMLEDRGQLHVHGHSHGHNGRIHGEGLRQFDVGVDANWLLPTRWEEIRSWAFSDKDAAQRA